MGWSRERAIDFMSNHTALSRSTIEVEVDRYITVPGQALAYKTGQLAFLRLRAHAKERLGDRFDIRRFHDTVLLQGMMPLSVLERRVNDWISREVGNGESD
jgi:uncharacterized protein (DUF885 family)